MEFKVQKILVLVLGIFLVASVALAGVREHQIAEQFRRGNELTRLPRPLSDREAKGQKIYHERQCAVCHGINGAGGVSNYNSTTAGSKVADLRSIADGYSREELKELIMNGKKDIKRDNETLLYPPLDMPGYKRTLSPDELEAVMDFVLALTPAKGAE